MAAFSPDYAEILAFGDRLVDVDKQVDGAKADLQRFFRMHSCSGGFLSQ